MKVASDAMFDECIRRGSDGRTVQCRLGLWRVDALTAEQAEREARHYWVQYWQDGEYDSLLSNDQADALLKGQEEQHAS